VKTYFVLAPADGSRNAEAANAVRFVREKFYWGALVFTPLWLIWHALWLAFCGWLVAAVAIASITYAFGLNQMASAVVLLLPSLVVAFEGAELRRRKLVRAGFRDAGVAIGETLEDAERRFFADWKLLTSEPNSADSQARPPRIMQPPAPNGVIGLFPEPGGGR
jgi:Protein of unknown function (DUF2628)